MYDSPTLGNCCIIRFLVVSLEKYLPADNAGEIKLGDVRGEENTDSGLGCSKHCSCFETIDVREIIS